MLLYTRGSVDALVVMYSINVFVTFSLCQLGMMRYWRRPETRKRFAEWRRPMAIAVVCFVLCAFILVVNLSREVHRGRLAHAWWSPARWSRVCLLIRRHYNGVYGRLKRLDQILDRAAAWARPPARWRSRRRSLPR